ncbi:MAG: DUF983 domain-containing protein [Alphaproteobacteria bacterium]|nr:DUF983 domain-containing protein [Alphaproteobacteria bacterium]
MTVTINGKSPALPRPRPWLRALWRGFRRRCPNCGKGSLLAGYLTVAESCENCGEALHHQRADDAPPYFTIFIVGHIVVPAVLVVEKLWQPTLAFHFILWTIVTLALTFLLMPSVKGAVVGLQWALRLHGFGGPSDHENE